MSSFYDPPPLPPLEAGRQLLPTIDGLRRLHPDSDRPILDLFHLLELGLVPGAVGTTYLRELWRCSQPAVSRRIRAVEGLGVFGVRSSHGAYVVTDRAAATWLPAGQMIHTQARTRKSARVERAERWEAARARVAAVLEAA
jgi:hypothetical protein